MEITPIGNLNYMTKTVSTDSHNLIGATVSYETHNSIIENYPTKYPVLEEVIWN